MSINKGKFDHSKLIRPKDVGPGCWKTLHLLAKYEDLGNLGAYSGFIRFFCKEFKCGDCRDHCGIYLNNNPPEKFKGKKWGMSEHSYEFHNAVNKRLGKPKLGWDEYMAVWINEPESGEGVCAKGCGDHSDQKSYPEELSESKFNTLKSVSSRDPSMVQLRRKPVDSSSAGGNITLIKRKR